MPEQATLTAIFTTSFLVGLSGAITPGPLLILDIREATRRGFIAGPQIALGHSILELLLVIVLALGFARFIEEGPTAGVIGTLGGLFLLRMAWGMLRHPGRGAPSTQAQGDPGAGAAWPIVGGVLVSLSNPYWSLWWATVGLSFMVWSLEWGFLGLALFYTGHICADIAWFSLVSFAIARGRRWMTDPLYRGLMASCGLFLAAMGGFFLYSGIGFFRG
jgi:threonine/homoserine/homoserine lactone efflux protein